MRLTSLRAMGMMAIFSASVYSSVESFQQRWIFSLSDPAHSNQHVAERRIPPGVKTGVFLGLASGVFARYQPDVLKRQSRFLKRSIAIFHREKVIAVRSPYHRCEQQLTGNGIDLAGKGVGSVWSVSAIVARNVTSSLSRCVEGRTSSVVIKT